MSFAIKLANSCPSSRHCGFVFSDHLMKVWYSCFSFSASPEEKQMTLMTLMSQCIFQSFCQAEICWSRNHQSWSVNRSVLQMSYILHLEFYMHIRTLRCLITKVSLLTESIRLRLGDSLSPWKCDVFSLCDCIWNC